MTAMFIHQNRELNDGFQGNITFDQRELISIKSSTMRNTQFVFIFEFVFFICQG